MLEKFDFLSNPVIVSASRATDIPAFYNQWFIQQLNQGFTLWKNPFNGKITKVCFDKCRLFVFWTKNPKPFFSYLTHLNSYNYYFQFSLNNYDTEKYEHQVFKLQDRIEIFKDLSSLIGKERIIWRFDPLLLSDKIDLNCLLDKIAFVGNQIHKFTDKLVFSFVCIEKYEKVKKNLSKTNDKFREFSIEEKYKFAESISSLNKYWNIQLASCAEEIDLSDYAICHNKCIDDELIRKLFFHDSDLMNFINQTGKNGLPLNLKDKGQRKYCNCIISKDIGMYNTCKHMCVYCYANK